MGGWERGESFLSVFVLWVYKSTHSYAYTSVYDVVHVKYTRNKWAPFKVSVYSLEAIVFSDEKSYFVTSSSPTFIRCRIADGTVKNWLTLSRSTISQ